MKYDHFHTNKFVSLCYNVPLVSWSWTYNMRLIYIAVFWQELGRRIVSQMDNMLSFEC